MENGKPLQMKIFELAAKNSSNIIFAFKLLYLVIFLFLLAGIYSTLTKNSTQPFFYHTAKQAAQVAVLLLGIIVLPGILGRFKIEIRITRIITLFRRYLGILVFLLVLTHYSLVRFFPTLQGLLPNIFSYQLFELLGLTAFSLLFLMFLTSNNFSVKKLGRWWKRLHRFIYLILWLIVLHTGLQRISVWTLYIGFFASLEILSLLYDWRRKKALTKPMI